MPECPLCLSKDHELLETIAARDLIALSRRSLVVDVSRFFSVPEIAALACRRCGLIFFDPQTPGDSEYYQELQAGLPYYATDKTEFRFAARLFPRSGRALDLGCGKGELAGVVMQAGLDYVGVDMNHTAVEEARSRNLNASCARLEDFLRDNRDPFDAICAFQILEHLADPRGFLRACIKSLAPGGMLIVSVPSQDSFLALQENHLLNLPPHHLTRWPDRTLNALAPMFGLKLNRLEHETVQPEHAAAYARSAYEAVLGPRSSRRRMVAAQRRLPDRLRSVVASLLIKLPGRVPAPPGLQGRGHSVMAAFENLNSPSATPL